MKEVPEATQNSSQTGKAPEPATGLSLLDVLILLSRERRFILYAGIVSGAVGLVVAFLIPVTYSATTKLLPPQQASSFSSTLLSQLGGLGALTGSGGAAGGLSSLKSPSDLYVGLLKSETVEDAMINRFSLQREYKEKYFSDARKDFERNVLIDGSEKDGLIRITVNSRSAARAAELANAYVDEYRHLSASLAIGEAAQRRLFLEQQLQQAKDKLALAEEDLKRNEQSTGMIQLDSQAKALIESAGAIRAQIAAKEVQIQSMRSYAGPGNTDLIQAEQELAGLQAQLAKLGAAGGDSDSSLLPSKGELPQLGLDYVRKLREVKYNETLFDILARQYEAAKLDEAREGAIVQVVDMAKAPDKKSWPPRLLIAITTALFGSIASISWVIFHQALRSLRHNPATVAKLSALGL